MKPLAFRPVPPPAPAMTARPRLYFVHVPKTAGVTLKTYLEDNFPLGSSLVIHEEAARQLPAGEINRYRLWTGHYSSEVLSALTPAPDVTVLVIRDPVARLRSWAAHERRSKRTEVPVYTPGMSDIDALNGPARPHMFQAYWVARAIRDGALSTYVPDASELPALLDRVTLVGLTEELDRFKQLVAFRMGWPPPPIGWQLNRRPDTPTPRADESEEALEIRRLLSVDVALYAHAATRFWNAYGAMLRTIRPDAIWPDAETPGSVPVETAQSWLQEWHLAQFADSHRQPVTQVELHAQAPASGEGWWWRQAPKGGTPYRWSGPATRASLLLPPLDPGGDYSLTMELVGAADWHTWEGLAVSINGHAADAVRERFGPVTPGTVNLRVHVRVTASMLAAKAGPTELTLTVPHSRPVPGAPLIDESTDTERRDTRQVGVALHRLEVSRASAVLAPAGGRLLTNRTGAEQAA